MVATKDHKKTGSYEFTARIRILVPLEDPQKCGNLGLEGFDEDGEYKDGLTDLAQARAWIDECLNGKLHGEPFVLAGQSFIASAEIEKALWVEEVYEDEEYGSIHDAYPELVHQWYFTVEDGKISYEEDFPANG